MRMFKLDFLSDNSGQTIIEVLIAIGVGALVLTAISASAIITVSNAQFAQKKTEALKYLQQGVEEVRIARDNAESWESFKELNWPSEPIVSAGVTFTRTTSINEEGSDLLEVTVTVSWDDPKGTHKVFSVTKLSQWGANEAE